MEAGQKRDDEEAKGKMGKKNIECNDREAVSEHAASPVPEPALSFR